jgi:acetyltransferase-like isoleucine patch superfamily enzyme
VRHWTDEPGNQISTPVPVLHPLSWIEAPVVVQATLAPNNLIQIGAFTGVFGGRLGHCSIGRFCSIAPGVDIASDQHPTDWLSTSMVQYVANVHGWGSWLARHEMGYQPPSRQFQSNSPARIGNDVWLGQGVFVKSGVRIGDGAIVAARSVVIKDVDPYMIVAGSPARVIRPRFPDAVVERLQRLQWWNFNVLGLGIDFSNVDEAVGRIEEVVASGAIERISTERFGFQKESVT